MSLSLNISPPKTPIYSPPGSPCPAMELSPADILAMQAVWSRAINEDGSVRNGPGLSSFRQIFMQMQEIRQVFGFTGMDDPNFLKHTMVFSEYLDKMMEALGDREEFDRLCVNLGRRHAYVSQVSFRTEYWDVFASSIIACALDEENYRVQTTWRTVVQYMIHKMKEAYNSEVRANHRKMSDQLFQEFSPTKAQTCPFETVPEAEV